MGQPLMDLHWFVFISIAFWKCWAEVGKTRENLSISSMLSAHCSSALASNSLYKNKKKSMEVHDWLRHRIVVVFFATQKSKAQTTLKKLIVLNEFANEEYICLYIHIWFVTRNT